MSKGQFVGSIETYLWELPRGTCEATVQEIYVGPATHIVPRNKKLEQQLIVNDSKRKVTFALTMSKPRDVCGAQLFETQLPGIYVAISPDNFLIYFGHHE